MKNKYLPIVIIGMMILLVGTVCAMSSETFDKMSPFGKLRYYLSGNLFTTWGEANCCAENQAGKNQHGNYVGYDEFWAEPGDKIDCDDGGCSYDKCAIDYYPDITIYLSGGGPTYNNINWNGWEEEKGEGVSFYIPSVYDWYWVEVYCCPESCETGDWETKVYVCEDNNWDYKGKYDKDDSCKWDSSGCWCNEEDENKYVDQDGLVHCKKSSYSKVNDGTWCSEYIKHDRCGRCSNDNIYWVDSDGATTNDICETCSYGCNTGGETCKSEVVIDCTDFGKEGDCISHSECEWVDADSWTLHEHCVAKSVCTPDCGGKECGSDGCSGSCGTCQTGYSCSNGQCVIGNGEVPECIGEEEIFYTKGQLAVNTKKFFGGKNSFSGSFEVNPGLAKTSLPLIVPSYFTNKATACCGNLTAVFVDKETGKIDSSNPNIWGVVSGFFTGAFTGATIGFVAGAPLGPGAVLTGTAGLVIGAIDGALIGTLMKDTESIDYSYNVYKCVPKGEGGFCLEFAHKWLNPYTDTDCQTNTIILIVLTVFGFILISKMAGCYGRFEMNAGEII